MHNLSLALEGAWRVLIVGLLLGAGLPAVFALGIRSLGMAGGGNASTVGEDPVDAPASAIGTTLATLCFLLVLVGVALGITFIVASGFGKALSFEHLYPTLVDK
ncbi:MAG: hypothetical protein ABI692_07005 [Terracoccus sp.]